MATRVNPVTERTDWTAPFDNTTNPYFTDTNGLSDPKAYALATTAWNTSFTGNSQLLVVTPAAESNNLALKFLGKPESVAAEATTGNVYRGQGAIWGISKLVKSSTTEFVAEFLGSFDLTVGTVSASASSILPNGTQGDEAFFCREIAPRVDASLFPGMRVVGQQGDASPILLIDSMGYHQFLIELKCNDPVGSTPATGLLLIHREF